MGKRNIITIRFPMALIQADAGISRIIAHHERCAGRRSNKVRTWQLGKSYTSSKEKLYKSLNCSSSLAQYFTISRTLGTATSPTTIFVLPQEAKRVKRNYKVSFKAKNAILCKEAELGKPFRLSEKQLLRKGYDRYEHFSRYDVTGSTSQFSYMIKDGAKVAKYARRNLSNLQVIGDTHNINTRQRHRLCTPARRLAKSDKTLGVLAPKVYNALPSDIKSAPSDAVFIGKLKKLLALEIRDASSLKASTGRFEDRSGRHDCISSRAPVCPVMGASSGAASCATALSLSGTRTTHQGALRVNLTGVSGPSNSSPVHPVTGCQRGNEAGKLKMAGKISEFDINNGNWECYCERLDMLFLVNDIKETFKVPTLISCVGEATYELMVNLCSPDKPKDKTYSQLVKLVGDHLQPKPSELAERFRFRQCRQRDDQTVAVFVAELKKAARFCEFGSHLDDCMRDQFVCGLRSDGTRQRLFAETKIDFAKAVQIATTIEAAERDAHAVEACSAGRVATAAAAEAREARSREPGASSLHHARAAECSACGDTRHRWADCRYRLFECSRCRKVGHLRRMCPATDQAGQANHSRADMPLQQQAWSGGPRRGQGGGGRRGGRGGATWRQRGGQQGGARATTSHLLREEEADMGPGEDGNNQEEPIHQMSLREYRPVSLTVKVENIFFKMEVDTGSALSCISKQSYLNHFKHVVLKQCELTLSFYDGSKIKPVGYLEVDVSYNGLTKKLDLYVIEGGTTALLGRQWLSELNITIPKIQVNNVSIQDKNQYVNELYSRYGEVWNGELGCFTGGRARLHVREGAAPVFCRARPLPYALRARVDAELDRMLRDGVIEPVETSDWATPLVIANKADGSLRLCADYKVTLNRVLAIDKYPVPKIEDLFTNLNGTNIYSKIDLSQAYNQVLLDETSQFTVINTHRGLFKYNRLVYGLSSSPGIFQRIMSNLFSDIPNVIIFLDDIMCANSTLEDHYATLSKVLERLRNYGLKIKREKCTFFTKQIKFLGYVIDSDGIRVDPEKVKPILKMIPPKDTSQLRSFLGMVNFYGKFIDKLSHTLAPLYELLKKDRVWVWGSEQMAAFDAVKQLLCNAQVLCHYDLSRPVTLSCDASAYGIGAILNQVDKAGRERPVAYASRALTDAERNYSQIHKEALAIVFAVNKFHQYLYGRKFLLKTDHKPLISIFGPGTGIPNMTASRLQRWAITLSAYDFDIQYVSTDQNTADCLSRLIAEHKADSDKNENNDMPEQTYLHFAAEALLLDNNNLKRTTQKDPLLSRVLSYIRDGWPDEVELRELRPYWNRRKELYTELGCVMWGHRVVIPEECRARVLRELHDTHMGVVKTKSIARSYVWWPGVDEAVEALCRSCGVCAAVSDAPPAHAPRGWPWPDRPWTRVHVDFLGPLAGSMYLVLVDACSKWIEIVKMGSTSAKNVISKLREIFSRFGLPKQLVSDNGPPFSSTEFIKILTDNGIESTFSAPYHPASNGAAENAVRTCKRVIKKAIIQGLDIETTLNRFLLMYRNTEHCTTGESPAQILQGRSLRTRLDKLKPEREDHVWAAQRRQVGAAGGRERALAVGDRVWCRNYRAGDKWVKGKIIEKPGDTDYVVELADGNQLHRHIDQIKKQFNIEPETAYEEMSPGRAINPFLYPSEPSADQGRGSVAAAVTSSGGTSGERGATPPAPPPQPVQHPRPVRDQTSRHQQRSSAPGDRMPAATLTSGASSCLSPATSAVPETTAKTENPIKIIL
ncbi:unnamed protein product [Plutella xylostella]|uniref:RNA-directed DNA polymerase n=1 Tax=Plutella xylostella TaxID=51655 RepID=A0A8S4FJF1_PLUXY|nr:unnamed protein product [Plutella xylostella]